MESEKNHKPKGRFQSIYTKELGSEPKYEDYAFATRHGGRDIQAQGKSDIGTRFKFPTQVSSYGMDYCNLKAPKLEDYGENKQPCNDRIVECAPLAGYNTTYSDGNFVLRHQDQLEAKERPKGKTTCQVNATKEHAKEESRPIFGPWNYTGQLKEDILIQRDKALRVERELYHLPGYMGHQPLHNPPSSTAYRRRSSEKEKMLLYDLDQYSRELWPHYKGHKPQALINVKEPPPPNTATTYGYTNHMMQKQQAWSKANNHARVTALPEKHKKATTKDFFTQGTSGSTSKNGLMMAERFYSFYRPLEGTLVSFQADKALASKYLD